MERVPNWNTLADAIDRLIVTVHKLAHFENKKREESLKPDPDTELIAHWDRLSRDQCEHRNQLKRAIDEILAEIVEAKRYEVLQDSRTFAEPKRSVSEILDEAIPAAWKAELSTALGEMFRE